ncbi:hypothetical protein PANT_20c00052 [Moesziomyces antarcticus T-34]|uniref:Uncharacterized protein n=1 Tax=Pseudozyma antarctica (strain T-34) TaxID=1151754 RepID=M9MHP9_PSEA3|nr:hypothetical protein PANT_20c00052 [Moesziomyces antarcticus T-34]
MFVPRKLQKRTHHGRAQTRTDEHDQDACAPQTHDTPAAHSVEVDAGKLERLVGFLHAVLDPLHVAFAARDEAHTLPTSTPWSDLAAAIAARSSGIHLARLLQLVPGLATRCKSISLLAEALTTCKTRAAAGWYGLDAFRVTWSDGYAEIVRDLVAASDVAEALGPRLVYIEHIPPTVRTRPQATEYVARLLKAGADAGVFGVLEPAVVQHALMADKTAELGGRWVSGRGFFVLDARSVEYLCDAYPWDLAQRSHKGEPLRCLSWSQWERLHAMYAAHQLAQQPAAPSVKVEDKWWRGTMLLLRLPVREGCLSVPEGGDRTVGFWNRHLKPQLERHVPESIAYMHTHHDAVAIRTAHPAYATQLLAHFPQLHRMPPSDEDDQWCQLPAKVHNAAHTRLLTLDHKLV